MKKKIMIFALVVLAFGANAQQESIILKKDGKTLNLQPSTIGSSTGEVSFDYSGRHNKIITGGLISKGKVGIAIKDTPLEGNLQVGYGTADGMVFLGGGKGYSGIGSTYSDGGLVLGWNIYSRYKDVSDSYIARVAKSMPSQGFTGIKLSHKGVIDFFGFNGKVTADEVANVGRNIRMRIAENGSIGIGTTAPEGNLQIGRGTGDGMLFLGGGKGYSGIGSTYSDGGLVLGCNIYSRYKDVSDSRIARVGKTQKSIGFTGIKLSHKGVIDFFGFNGDVVADQVANTDANVKMRIDENGNIGIGTVKPDSKLTVAGRIHSREVKVTVNAGADFVFANDYDLPSLEQVESFVRENRHLPNIKPANHMEKNGICLSEMNIKLLQKIEELTLYTIAQEKKIKSLENHNSKIQELEGENKSLKDRLSKIEERLQSRGF